MKINKVLGASLEEKFKTEAKLRVASVKPSESDCLSDNKNSLICSVCVDIVDNPTSCSNCQNFYCKTCI
jgi:hypothetical protein